MKTKFEQVFARYIPFFPLFSTGQLVDQSRESSRDQESGGKNQVVLPDLLVEGLWEKKRGNDKKACGITRDGSTIGLLRSG